MATTAWCMNCLAEVTVENDAAGGTEPICPICQQQVVALGEPLGEGLSLAVCELDAGSRDPFEELPTASSHLPQTPAITISKARSKAASRERIGPDGLTDSQRRIDAIVRVIGGSIIGITVIVWIVVGLRPHEGMSPLYVWIPGSFPVVLMGLLIAIYGAVFDEEARKNRRRGLIVVGASLLPIAVVLIAIALPATAPPAGVAGAVQTRGILRVVYLVPFAGVALCLGLADLLTGQCFLKILLELGRSD